MQAEDLRVREDPGASGSLAKATNSTGGNRGLWPEVAAALPVSRPQIGKRDELLVRLLQETP
jgi:hypothetical protein